MNDNCATGGEKPSLLTSLVQTLKSVLTVAVFIFNATTLHPEELPRPWRTINKNLHI